MSLYIMAYYQTLIKHLRSDYTMTMTTEQIEANLQQDIAKRSMPINGANAFEQLDSEFSNTANPLSTTEVAKVTRQQGIADSDQTAVLELSPEEEDEQFIAAALKNMSNTDRATTAFVERHKKDFYPSPET